jgi:hypothetical protein
MEPERQHIHVCNTVQFFAACGGENIFIRLDITLLAKEWANLYFYANL